MTILLVRHAESTGNVDAEVHEYVADQSIPLTEKGQEQALAVGLFLKDWYAQNPPKKEVRLWCSPYKRTLQTLLGLKQTIGTWAWNKCGRGQDIHFDERLRERDWGTYRVTDYAPGGRLEKEQPEIFKHYRKMRKAPMGRLLARPVGGESLADVTTRLRSFFHDIHFDIAHGVTDHLIVMHGAAKQAFVYAFTKSHPQFMDDDHVAENTGVRLLDLDPVTGRYMDYGVIYDPVKNIYLTEKPKHPVSRDLSRILEPETANLTKPSYPDL